MPSSLLKKLQFKAGFVSLRAAPSQHVTQQRDVFLLVSPVMLIGREKYCSEQILLDGCRCAGGMSVPRGSCFSNGMTGKACKEEALLRAGQVALVPL